MKIHRTFRRFLFVGAAALALQSASQQAVAALAYASNGTSIYRFDTDDLGDVESVPVTGLQGGETLVGIDVRPADSLVYAVGSTNRLYTVNPKTGVATQIGAAGQFVIAGTSFGFDFNPVPDRIRLVSNSEQNIRINPLTGGLAGTDTVLTPLGNVVAAAYTNSFAGATTTTLYGIDSAAGTLVLVGSVGGTPLSPNTGVVTTVGSLGLGTNLNENIGFDISGVTGVAMATITTGGVSNLYSINLSTGSATLLGEIGFSSSAYSGFALATYKVPSLEEVGGEYGRFLLFSQLVAHGTGINPNAILGATLPYGTNAAYYSYFSALYLSVFLPTQYASLSVDAYYDYLGDLYAYQNYQFPAYAANLQSFYHAYGASQAQAIENAAEPTASYYSNVASYYEALIYP